MPSAENKFSLLQFAQQQNQGEIMLRSQKNDGELNQQTLQQRFEQLVEQARQMLLHRSALAHSEEEQLRYSETLNRAVLGFQEAREYILTVIQDWIVKQRIHDLAPQGFASLAEALFAEVIGMNVLELVLKDKKHLEEVQVVGKQIFEVRHGRAAASIYHFQRIGDVARIQQNLVLFNHDVLSPQKKWAEVMLSDGSRVTMTGFGFTHTPTLTIRFFSLHVFTLDALCERPYESMDQNVAVLLQALLKARVNLVVIGATNSGKTHLMKALINELPDEERIITIENRLELMISRDFPQKNIIEYEVDEEDLKHSSRQAFKLALRQSPQRIIHAEIRDEDANIYVRACTRGHQGSMTTVHANHLEDVPQVIADMCMLDQRGMDSNRLTKRIAEYVTNIGIQLETIAGQRKIVRVVEYDFKNEKLQPRELVNYNISEKKWCLSEMPTLKLQQRIRKYDPSAASLWKDWIS